MVEGGGLENRCPERDRGFESYSLRQKKEIVLVMSEKPRGEMAEPAEGARLLSEYGAKVPSRVRIPLSPPFDCSCPCD